MKLFFDARYITSGQHDGISRFSTELAKAIYKLEPETTFIISDLNQKSRLPKDVKIVKIHSPTSWKEPFSSIILNRFAPEIVFSPMQTIGSFGKKFKLVLTVHDLIYFRHNSPPKHFSVPIKLLWWIYHLTFITERFILNRADLIATVSKTTKKDLLKFKLTKKPIVITHNAPTDLVFENEHNFDNPKNLIYMGSFIGYKNVEVLIEAMKFLPEYKLHLLSKISDKRKNELKELSNANSNIIFHNGVSDKDYHKLLLDNSILVSASKDEGYGLPVVEALVNAVPVVISDIPIFHEVAGPGALYFNNSNPKDFADKILQLQDKAIYKKTASAGQKYVRQFNWNSSAKSLIDEIKSNLLK